MKKLNIPTKNMNHYAGKWVAVDTKKNLIIAVGKTLKEISSFVSGKTGEKNKIAGAAFKVPRKNEGRYLVV